MRWPYHTSLMLDCLLAGSFALGYGILFVRESVCCDRMHVLRKVYEIPRVN